MRAKTSSYLKDFLPSLVSYLTLFPGVIALCVFAKVPLSAGMVTLAVSFALIPLFSHYKVQVFGPSNQVLVMVMFLAETYGVLGVQLSTVGCGLGLIAAGSTKFSKWLKVISPYVLDGLMTGMGFIIIKHQAMELVEQSKNDAGEVVATMLALVSIFILNRFRYLKKFPPQLTVIALFALMNSIGWVSLNTLDFQSNQLSDVVVNFSSIARIVEQKDFWFYTLSLFFVLAYRLTITLSYLENNEERGTSSEIMSKEFKIHGWVNIIAGALGGVASSSKLAIAVLEKDLGATTKISSYWKLIFLGLSAIFFLPYFSYIPKSIILAIIIYTTFKLVPFARFKEMKAFAREEKVVFLGTFITTVLFGVEFGVIFGICMSGAKVLMAFSSDLEIEFHQRSDEPHLCFLKLSGAVTFLNLPKLTDALADLPKNAQLEVNASEVYYFDLSCIHYFQKLEKNLSINGGKLIADLQSLVFRANSPKNSRSQILHELRILDSKGSESSSHIGRRKIDRVLYGQETSQSSVVELRPLQNRKKAE